MDYKYVKMPSFQQMLAYKKEIFLFGRFRITKRIGGGSFGDIYLAIIESTGDVRIVHIPVEITV